MIYAMNLLNYLSLIYRADIRNLTTDNPMWFESGPHHVPPCDHMWKIRSGPGRNLKTISAISAQVIVHGGNPSFLSFIKFLLYFSASYSSNDQNSQILLHSGAESTEKNRSLQFLQNYVTI